MSQFNPNHPLRRSLIGGYRVAEVEVLVAQLRLLASQVDTELRLTRERLESAEADRRELIRRLDEAHAREVDVLETASQMRREHEAAERRAEQHVREITEAALAEAARIRTQASADAEEARAQADELLHLRDSLRTTVRGVVRDLQNVIRRTEEVSSTTAEPIPPLPAAAPTAAAAETPASRVAPPPIALAPTLAPTPDDVFDREIELEAGPFNDFASLSAFERSLGTLPKVEGVYIRRFEGDRATIDVTLEEPAPLLAAMTQRMPYRIDVQSAVPDRISLIVKTA